MGIDRTQHHSGHSKATRRNSKQPRPISPLSRGRKPKSPPSKRKKDESSPITYSDCDSLKTFQRCYRVGTACQRCRVRKTKCDNQLPCQRCQDDGLFCTRGSNMRAHGAHGPMMQVQILEHTRSVLVALINKLYLMGRSKILWTYGDIIENGNGDPLIYDMAEKMLGISARNLSLEETTSANALLGDAGIGPKPVTPPQPPNDEAAASAEEDEPSPLLRDIGSQTIGSAEASAMVAKPQNPQAGIQGTESLSRLDVIRYAAMQHRQQQFLAQKLAIHRHYGMQFLRYNSILPNKLDLLGAGLLESNLGTVTPHQLLCAEPGVMKGIGDPMLADTHESDVAGQLVR